MARLIFSVVSCKSNNVRPQEGQEIYSVLEILVRVAWSMENDILFKYGKFKCVFELRRTPSPRPSQSKLPKSIEALIFN